MRLHLEPGSQVCNSTTIASVQEQCSTLAGVGHFGNRFSAFWPRFLFACCRECFQQVMADANSEMRFVDLPERTEDDLAIPVSNEEPTKNVSRSWAE